MYVLLLFPLDYLTKFLKLSQNADEGPVFRFKLLFHLFTFLLASTFYIGLDRYKQSHINLCIRAYFSILITTEFCPHACIRELHMDVFSFPWKFLILFPLYNQQIVFALLLIIPYKTWFFRYMSSTEEASKCDLSTGTGAVGVTQCLSRLISPVLTHSGPEGLPCAATSPAMPSAALAHPGQGVSLQKWSNSQMSNTLSVSMIYKGQGQHGT